MILAFAIAVIAIYLTINWLTLKPKNYPPGPPCFPIIGSALSIPSKLAHVTMAEKWQKKYGPVVGYIVGSYKYVAVCGPHSVLEVLRRDEFQGRPNNEMVKERSFKKCLGIIFSDGPYWVEQRRFTLRHLRDFGFGKTSMESLILEEISDVMKKLSQKQVFQVHGFFTVPVLNVIWGMTAGKRLSQDDNELQDLLDKLNSIFRRVNLAGGFVVLIFPLMKLIQEHTYLTKCLRALQNYFLRNIKEHEKSIDENNPRDYIDVYLNEMKLKRSNPNTTFTEESLITMCLDLFSAGSETTTGTLEFLILYMALYPEVQKTVQTEIDMVIGQNRKPSLEDRSKCHYAEAVLNEVQRISTVAPLGIPHRAVTETELNGYSIPKDTTILVCLHSLFHDKEHWGDPENFRPERFLNEEGKFVKDEWMIPFGTGKRTCLAETLARNSLFLFFTSLFQEFTFSVPEGDPEPSTRPQSGITVAPHPFRVKATSRF